MSRFVHSAWDGACKRTRTWALVIVVGSMTGMAMGQCTNVTPFATVAAPTTPTAVTISTCTFQSEYNTVTGIVAGATYTVTSSCGGYITVRRGTYNGALVANGTPPPSPPPPPPPVTVSTCTFQSEYNTITDCRAPTSVGSISAATLQASYHGSRCGGGARQAPLSFVAPCPVPLLARLSRGVPHPSAAPPPSLALPAQLVHPALP